MPIHEEKPDTPERSVVSAGGVVVRTDRAAFEVLVLTRLHGRVRCLPKGGIEDGETIEAAALREVREEGGVTAQVMAPLPKIDYWFFGSPGSTRYHKSVHFFLMSYVSGDTADHDDEVEAADWVVADAALEMLTYPKERETARRALQLAGRSEQDGRRCGEKTQGGPSG